MCVYIITILYGTETPVEIGDHIHPGTHRKTSECKLGLSIQLIHTSMCHVRRWYCFLFSWQVSFPQESSLTWSLRLKTRFWVLKEEEKEREGARKNVHCSLKDLEDATVSCSLSKLSHWNTRNHTWNIRWQQPHTKKKKIPTLLTM